jgi:ribonuclease Z
VKIVYSGDTRPCITLNKLADNADILIHDSTFDETRKDKAFEYGHSTAKQAARTAKQTKASKLILTHISPIYEGEEETLLDEARDIFHGKIQLAFDFLHLKVYP